MIERLEMPSQKHHTSKTAHEKSVSRPHARGELLSLRSARDLALVLCSLPLAVCPELTLHSGAQGLRQPVDALQAPPHAHHTRTHSSFWTGATEGVKEALYQLSCVTNTPKRGDATCASSPVSEGSVTRSAWPAWGPWGSLFQCLRESTRCPRLLPPICRLGGLEGASSQESTLGSRHCWNLLASGTLLWSG